MPGEHNFTPEQLEDKWWRLNHLYLIQNEDGVTVQFKCNWAQTKFYAAIWFKNVILKARQLGFCLDPATRVLTADLRWVPIGDIEPGTEVVAVDEYPLTSGRGSSRRMRTASVIGRREVVESAYTITFDDGRSVTCSGKHRWFSKMTNTQGDWRSVESPTKKKLRVGTKVRWITKPWSEGDFEDGWFGGIIDGEGSFSNGNGSNGVCACQKKGIIWSRMREYASDRGYNACVESDNSVRPSKHGDEPCPKLAFGRMDELFRLLGQTRPVRSLGTRFWEGRDMPGKRSGIGWSTIVSIEPVGTRRLVDLQTSTGTFIAEGFVSHNSTLIDLWILDECLFQPGLEAIIIADTKPHAEDLFRRKVKFPFDNLPVAIGGIIMPEDGTKGSAGQLKLNNGSVLSVVTSARSGTIQLLHISEFGKIAATHPDKADEIVTGTLPAAKSHKAMVFIESTAEGYGGHFHEYCEESRKVKREVDAGTRELTFMDYRFHFYAWWMEPVYKLTGPPLQLSDKDIKYFDKVIADVREQMGMEITLIDDQKRWYLAKARELKELMKREYPSTPDEAFEQSIEGAYFSAQMAKARNDGRICSVPVQDGVMVDTWWDLGMDDTTVIWFTQNIGREIHVVDYHEANGEGLAYYKDVLDKKKYRYGRTVGPHDLAVRELGTGKSRLETAASLGLRFEVVPKVNDKMDAIEAARNIFKVCWFDKAKCIEGIGHLDKYRKEWDPKRTVFRSSPLHDMHSNGADGFQTFAMGHRWGGAGFFGGGGGRREVVTSTKWGGV